MTRAEIKKLDKEITEWCEEYSVCRSCNKCFSHLDPHHMIPRWYKSTRWVWANIMPVCFICHCGLGACPKDSEVKYHAYALEDWYLLQVLKQHTNKFSYEENLEMIGWSAERVLARYEGRE